MSAAKDDEGEGVRLRAWNGAEDLLRRPERQEVQEYRPDQPFHYPLRNLFA
jgi:hypothetical protein